MLRSQVPFEDAVLTNEKVCIAARMFDCYQVDLTEVEEGHPLLDLVKKPKPLTFHAVYAGKLMYSSSERPSASEIVTICSRTLKKTFGITLDKIVREEQKILDELEEVLVAQDKCEATRLKKGASLSQREDEDLQKLEQILAVREADLREAERKLLDIEQYRAAEDAGSAANTKN